MRNEVRGQKQTSTHTHTHTAIQLYSGSKSHKGSSIYDVHKKLGF